jgi:hypothetical protein
VHLAGLMSAEVNLVLENHAVMVGKEKAGRQAIGLGGLPFAINP